MAIFFHVHDNIACKYVCHSDCSEYAGTCAHCVEIKLGINKGKFACVHIKDHITEADITYLVEHIMHAHT